MASRFALMCLSLKIRNEKGIKRAFGNRKRIENTNGAETGVDHLEPLALDALKKDGGGALLLQHQGGPRPPQSGPGSSLRARI
jgi:hypothetical protein